VNDMTKTQHNGIDDLAGVGHDVAEAHLAKVAGGRPKPERPVNWFDRPPLDGFLRIPPVNPDYR
jgi:hypothetical protein